MSRRFGMRRTYGQEVKAKGFGGGIANVEALPTPFTPVVYVVKDPDTLEVKSVGRTSNALQRYTNYCSPNMAKDKRSKREQWQIELKRQGKRPIMELVVLCDNDEEAKLLEPVCDMHYREQGHNLVNADKYPVRYAQLAKRAMKECTTINDRMMRVVELYNAGY